MNPGDRQQAIMDWIRDDLGLGMSEVREIRADGQWGYDFQIGSIPAFWLTATVVFADDRLPVTQLFSFVVTS